MNGPLKTVIIMAFFCLCALGFVYIAPFIAPYPNTPYQYFSLAVNETFTENYSVHHVFLYKDHPDIYGYMILSTSVPGTYEMTVTTDKRDDVVGLKWDQTFVCSEIVGDKFERKEVFNRCVRFGIGELGRHHCVSDNNADCKVTMTQGPGVSPELQITINGRGTGNITIRRIA